MLAKREADIEVYLRKDRVWISHRIFLSLNISHIQEREIRSDLDMQEFKTRRMSENEQILEAKKEQARLSKHIVSKI